MKDGLAFDTPARFWGGSDGILCRGKTNAAVASVTNFMSINQGAGVSGDGRTERKVPFCFSMQMSNPYGYPTGFHATVQGSRRQSHSAAIWQLIRRNMPLWIYDTSGTSPATSRAELLAQRPNTGIYIKVMVMDVKKDGTVVCQFLGGSGGISNLTGSDGNLAGVGKDGTNLSGVAITAISGVVNDGWVVRGDTRSGKPNPDYASAGAGVSDLSGWKVATPDKDYRAWKGLKDAMYYDQSPGAGDGRNTYFGINKSNFSEFQPTTATLAAGANLTELVMKTLFDRVKQFGSGMPEIPVAADGMENARRDSYMVISDRQEETSYWQSMAGDRRIVSSKGDGGPVMLRGGFEGLSFNNHVWYADDRCPPENVFILALMNFWKVRASMPGFVPISGSDGGSYMHPIPRMGEWRAHWEEDCNIVCEAPGNQGRIYRT